MEIDLVLPYVDMSKKNWQQIYYATNLKLGRCVSESNRYRQLLDLKYMLRCIDKFCPFVRTLFLVVQTRDQVPDYVKESSRLKIIEHKDIIPEELLPTFNSSTIELHIHKIPDLSEHFIYINDDMYPLNYLTMSDFFTEDGKPKINVALRTQTINVYRLFLKNSENFVKRVLNISDSTQDNQFYRDGHSWTPMRKSHLEMLYNFDSTLKDSCTPFRDKKNLVQQVATYYEYFTDNLAPRTIKTKYWDFKKDTKLCDFLNGDYHIVCINDSGLKVGLLSQMRNLRTWFQRIVPDKSERYEK